MHARWLVVGMLSITADNQEELTGQLVQPRWPWSQPPSSALRLLLAIDISAIEQARDIFWNS